MKMFGITIDRPADVFFDNKSVTINVALPPSLMNKRHNEICNHSACKEYSTDVIRVGWIQGEYKYFI